MSSKPNSVSVETPMSLDDRSEVAFEEIPMPPSEMWGDLNNTAGDEVADPAPAEAESGEAEAVEVAVLEFVGESHERTIDLKHPFRLNGKTVERITVRRFRIADVDGLLKRIGAKKISLFDVYEHMTGIPAPVLRGLIDEDGDAVTDAAFDFLPRAIKPDAP